MSTPVVSGAVALIQEQFRRIFGIIPNSATVKALMVHTTRLVDGKTGPSYSHGFGLLQVKPAIDLIIDDNGTNSYIRVESLNHNETHQFNIDVINPSLPLKATIAWNDPKAAADSDPALVNNLDIKAISPNSDN